MGMNWLDKAEQLREQYIEDLKAFLSINSVEDMDTATEGKPFGEGVAKALQYMLDKGQQDGFVTKNLEGYAGYIEYGTGEEIGILAHVDVVPVGDGWTTPPFQPDIRNGRIYARGAIDDKGPGLAAYYGMKIVRDLGLPLSKRVRFIVGTDEESGWLCMKRYAELEKLPEIGFSPDAAFPIYHAEKGQINPVIVMDPQSKNEQGTFTLLSFKAGERVNMVPDIAKAQVKLITEADAVLIGEEFRSFLEKQNAEGTFEQKEDVLVFSVEGKSAHGMEPFAGINAGFLLASFLHKVDLSSHDKQFVTFIVNVLKDDFDGVHLGVACKDEVTGRLTVNAGVLEYNENGGQIKLNIRYPATVPTDSLTPILKDKLQTYGWSIQDIRISKAHHVPKDHPSIKLLQKAYEEQTGEEAQLMYTGGATYARSMKYGVAFGGTFPGKENTAHHKDEYAEVDDLIKSIAIYAQAIYELAK